MSDLLNYTHLCENIAKSFFQNLTIMIKLFFPGVVTVCLYIYIYVENHELLNDFSETLK